MAEKSAERDFPAINLMPHRARILSGNQPAVKVRYWVALALVTVVLIGTMGVLLLPRLLPGGGP